MTAPRVLPAGDGALVIEFKDGADAESLAWARGLDRALAARPFPGFLESAPAYASLLVAFDPLATDHAQARGALERLMVDMDLDQAPGARRVVEVCYDGDFAPDLDAVAEACGLPREAAVQAHLAGDYSVAMYGFAPGYAYLSGVPSALRLPRKPAPVRDVPAGSVIVAGAQCLVTTLTMPTGWWIIGRSPTVILDQAAERPFLFDPGDAVEFRRIDRAAFDARR